MSTPFLGELRLMSFVFPPRGWAHCNGQLLPISQNQPLFSLLGTTYGGNGQVNFALPDLRGRTPIHVGAGFSQGQVFGEEFHTVTIGEMPQHVHALNASTASGNQAAPWLLAAGEDRYRADGPSTALAPGSVGIAGGSQAHENRPPSLVLSWCIALAGVFPSPN